MPSPRLLNFLDAGSPTLFNDEVRAFLEAQFDVTHFDRRDWSPQHVAKYFGEVSPQIILTGWGCENLSVTDALVRSTPALQTWAHVGSSMKAIFDAPETVSRLRVLTTASIIGRYVVESTIGHLIYGLRGFHFLNARFISDQQWGHLDEAPEREKSLYHATVGLVGLGKVGREVVRMLKPFGTRILVYDPYLPAMAAHELDVELVPLRALLERSDAVSLHAAATDDTHHLIDASALSAMRSGSGLINTARGALVDTQALAAEVRAGRLWCALDTYEEERQRPLSEDPCFQLAHLPNCFLTPHVAGIVPSARAIMVKELLAETRRVWQSQEPSPLEASRDAFVMG